MPRTFENVANLLVRQFENEHGRRSWENEDDPSSRLKFVENCIRMVGVIERSSTLSGDESKSGLEETLSAIRNGEEMLMVTDVNVDDVKVIAEELKTNTSLLALYFGWGNDIGPQGARHISDALRQNCTLLYLGIGYNQIGPEGARHLSDMLRENCTLLELDIQDNQIGPEGARHLSDALRENRTLLFLILSDNQIDDDGARHLSDMLRENRSLLDLDIEDNWFGVDGARHLSDVLRENSTLLYLDIGDYNNDEIKSRTSSSDSKERSYDECRAFLQDYLGKL